MTDDDVREDAILILDIAASGGGQLLFDVGASIGAKWSAVYFASEALYRLCEVDHLNWREVCAEAAQQIRETMGRRRKRPRCI